MQCIPLSGSACYLVMKLEKKEDKKNEMVIGAEKETLKQCIKDMFVFYRDFPFKRFPTLFQKFKDEQYNKTVARILNAGYINYIIHTGSLIP